MKSDQLLKTTDKILDHLDAVLEGTDIASRVDRIIASAAQGMGSCSCCNPLTHDPVRHGDDLVFNAQNPITCNDQVNWLVSTFINERTILPKRLEKLKETYDYWAIEDARDKDI